MTDYKLVPVEPTPGMVSAAEEAYMPFGDMDLALRMAILAATAVQGEPVAWMTSARVFGEGFTTDRRQAKKWMKSYPSKTTSLYATPPPAEQQPAPDVTQLVEALEAIVSHHDEYFRDSSTESRMPWIGQAREALAAYRKGDAS